MAGRTSSANLATERVLKVGVPTGLVVINHTDRDSVLSARESLCPYVFHCTGSSRQSAAPTICCSSSSVCFVSTIAPCSSKAASSACSASSSHGEGRQRDAAQAPRPPSDGRRTVYADRLEIDVVMTSMFIGVNSKCAHQVRPPLSRI